ncbi:MAG: GNAT family N-acetyltransferase [Phenylobacterium sp.]|uniref:GNAT family N-acetyltransferase n=1 Tax=Phenylobacterium sp. TaxID=1871053 RepID=UPI00391BA637
MSPDELESIERATVAAVAPARVMELPGWVLALDQGTIGRAHSAAPFSLEMTADAVPRIEALYAEAGLSPVWRIGDEPGHEPIRVALSERGYRPDTPTLLKTGSIARMIAAFRGAPAELIDAPDADWAAVFTGEGFDPEDGFNRVAAFTRSPGALYGRVRDGARTVAVGVMSFHGGWASIHGMRTAQDRRGEGAAGRILATLAAEAQARGVAKVFLQVTEENPARGLYRRFGFERRRRYWYWRKA